MKPDKVLNGLAIYSRGKGDPLFLMPYPHASSARSSAEGRLGDLVVASGFRLITFDPPSFARSTRQSVATLQEMTECTRECLEYYHLSDPIPFLGHSMGGFCCLAMAIECPSNFSSLVISGSPSGWSDVRRHSVHKKFRWWEKKFWQTRYYGARIILNNSNLSIHKKLDNLTNYECFHDKNLFDPIIIVPNDKNSPPPPRAIWLKNVRNYDYSGRLGEISCPVLIASGKYDYMVPQEVSERIKNKIPGAVLVRFEESGHSPFIEEKEKFSEMLKEFLKKSS